MKKVLKRLLLAAAIVLAVVVLAIAGFAVAGGVMHRQAVSELSVEAAAEEIRGREGFTEYAELPEFYINAVLAAEDRHFNEHCGIHLPSIMRALWYDIRTFSLAQGGSTITQQLAKNLYYTEEKRLERKFAEVFTAFELERRLSKNEIFELYVNTIYFGSGYYGVSDAARGYFGKEVAELSEYECAMLAGLPNAPSAYSPDSAPELARERLEQVLECMTDWGVISEQKAEEISEAA